MMNRTTKEEFTQELYDWAKNWENDIQKSLKRNITLYLNGIGNMGEYLASLISGKHGAASGGSGFDLSNGTTADESKFACLVQAKKCTNKECEKKFLFFMPTDKCEKCGSNLDYMSDSRWGIDSDAGIKYHNELEYYWMQILEPVKYHYSCREFVYKCFRIDAKDKNFYEYLKNQNDNGSKNNCNFQPYSVDFYRSSPVLVAEFKIEIGIETKVTPTFFDLDNQQPEEFDTQILEITHCKRTLEVLGLDETKIYPYTQNKNKSWSKQDVLETGFHKERDYLIKIILENLNGKKLSEIVPIKPKSLGKERGTTKRKL
jgi:hypothetical protein